MNWGYESAGALNSSILQGVLGISGCIASIRFLVFKTQAWSLGCILQSWNWTIFEFSNKSSKNPPSQLPPRSKQRTSESFLALAFLGRPTLE